MVEVATTYGELEKGDKLSIDGEVWVAHTVEKSGKVWVNALDPEGEVHCLSQRRSDPVFVVR